MSEPSEDTGTYTLQPAQSQQPREPVPETVADVLEHLAPGSLTRLKSRQRRKLQDHILIQHRTESLSVSYQQTFMPPPDVVERYNALDPEIIEIWKEQWKTQSSHRQALEKQAVTAQLKESGRGQIMAFLIAIIGISCSTFLTYCGHAIVGSILGGGTIVSLVGAFIYGKQKQKSSLKEKG